MRFFFCAHTHEFIFLPNREKKIVVRVYANRFFIFPTTIILQYYIYTHVYIYATTERFSTNAFYVYIFVFYITCYTPTTYNYIYVCVYERCDDFRKLRLSKRCTFYKFGTIPKVCPALILLKLDLQYKKKNSEVRAKTNNLV